MASHETPQLSLLERLSLIPIIGSSIYSTISSILFGILRTQDLSKRNIRRYAIRGVVRTLPNLPLRQSRYLLPPTGSTVGKYAASHGLRHEIINLNAGDDYPPCRLHFVDSASTATDGDIFLYMHGGGFTMAASADHPPFALKAAKAAGAGLAFLEYGLAPEVPYPGQLAHSSSALRWLLSRGWKASQIIIGGDSAGGNMSLGLLAHCISPKPGIESVDLQAEKLKGALILSPRCGAKHDFPSYERNAGKDILTIESMELFKARMRTTPGEVWGTPLRGDSDFWKQAPVHRLIMLAGGDEVFVDEVVEMGKLIGCTKEVGDRMVNVAPGEIHVQCLFDTGMGLEDGGMMTEAMSWMRSIRS